MTVETKLPVNREYIQSFSKENGEPEWFAALRIESLEKAETLPLPKADKTKIDKWNFTSFQTHYVKSDTFESLEQLPEDAKALIRLETEKNLYIQRNQTPAYLQLTDELKEKGVIFTDILTALREHGDLVQKYFMKHVKADENKLTSLHAALLNGGVFLYIPKNVELKDPIQAVFLQDDNQVPLFNHVLIVADENSSVTYVENYISTVEVPEGIANIVTEVVAEAGAKVTYGAVDTLASGVTSYVNRRGTAGRDARIE